ncbi:molybdopterin-dependent oxidoreductase [Altererythrobacter lauratis]|uniref:Molybdopterin-dependent oxidoreductase n=1 Tax=Alteraurantiacibacter lauratis TaxID=2054627 RepID=A0ABV7EIL3_9SPHN
MPRTTCPYCGVGCGIVAEADASGDIRIAGDRAHPANRGKLCSKGTHLGETIGLEGRLLAPMIGGQEVGWDAALDDVAERLRTTVAEHGPDAVAFYVSGQLLTEDYYVANKLAKGFIGTGNIDTNSRLCMASAVAAHNRAFGEDVVPCSYADLDDADLILLVGSNTAWCHPVIWQRIEAAREARGTKLVVIDPRRTETAERADLHVAVAPDGDVALFNALLAEMAARGLVDEDYLRNHCVVPDGFWDGLGTAAVAQFAELADLVAAHPRMVTLFSQGVNQSDSGTNKGNAIINLHLATGRINTPGAGPFSITGQPNAMGGREVGGLATTLACHLGFTDEEREEVARFWQAPALAKAPGLKAVDLFRAVADGRIRFIWIMATNPAVSMPDAGAVRAALALCPHVVVSDMFGDTDTARFAHVRLPSLGWGEKDGTVTNSERTVSRQRPFLPSPGNARADWRIICDVAVRLGYGHAFAYSSPVEIFREYAAMTGLARRAGKRLDLAALAHISDAAYDALEPFQWGGRHPLARGFSTPDGKARLVAVTPPAARKDPDFPFRLNTGRYRDQWHTMTRTGRSARLAAHRREPLVEIHPADAATLALAEGALARLVTPVGEAVYRAAVSEGQSRGQLFVPMHWSDTNASLGRTGRLVPALADPHSGQPALKNVPARLVPVLPEWRGFLVSRTASAAPVAHWTRSRIAGGWITEMAGEGAIPVDALLPDGLRSEVCDAARGMRRIAVSDGEGALLALLYLTRGGRLPERDWIIRQFDSGTATLAELLAGRPAAAQPDRGALVCVCHDVGETAILAAVKGGAGTVAQVGAVTCAGTNCGSCRPIIARLLEQSLQTEKEAAE